MPEKLVSVPRVSTTRLSSPLPGGTKNSTLRTTSEPVYPATLLSVWMPYTSSITAGTPPTVMLISSRSVPKLSPARRTSPGVPRVG